MQRYKIDTASSKRQDRKNKIKRVFNYEPEMKYLYSYYELKGKSIPVEEFIELARKTQLETDQVSDVVFDFFIDELRTKQLIIDKTKELESYEQKTNQLKTVINELKKSLEDKVDDSDEDELRYLDLDGLDYYSNDPSYKVFFDMMKNIK